MQAKKHHVSPVGFSFASAQKETGGADNTAGQRAFQQPRANEDCLMARSFAQAAPPVNSRDGGGPLFNVGEIWKWTDFIDRLGGDKARKPTQLKAAGLEPYDCGGTSLILIDQLVQMMVAKTPVEKYEANWKRRKRKKE